jgi:S-formylglutathione hydrolase
MTLTTLKEHRCCGGVQAVYRHESAETRCTMEFAVFRPPQAERRPVPVLYWLSGLTCTWANFTEKAGVQRYAAEQGQPAWRRSARPGRRV